MKRRLIILLLCCVAFFANNWVIFPDIMESRNIITAREMVNEGHWIVPTMNGELRLEKPPLPTWIAAVVEEVIPDSIAAQRAMAGIAATMLLLFFFLLAEKVTRNEQYAFIASLLLLTCYNIILMGRTASWDIYCHAFMLGAIYFFYSAAIARGPQYGRFALAGVFLGLSFMSKGPVSFYALLLPFLIAMILFDCPTMRGKWKPVLLMILICLILSSWWYVILFVFYPNEAQYVIHKESGAWSGHNVRPWFYYWKFFLETGVWSLLMITTLVITFWKRKIVYREKYLSAMCWMLAALVLLSLLPEKKSRYLLPMLIPCCYAMAFVICHWIKDRSFRKTDKWFYYINTGLISLIVVVLPVLLYLFFVSKGLIPIWLFVLSSVLIFAIAIVMIFSTLRWKPALFVYSVVALFAIAELFLMPYVGNLVNNPDFHSVSETRKIHKLDGVPFYYNEVKGHEDEYVRAIPQLVYEAYRKIRPIDVNDENAVMQALPMALLSHERVDKVLPASLLQKVDTVYIGHFDNNRRQKGTHFYSGDYIYDITLIRKK